MLHLIYGCADELSVVEAVAVLHIFGQVFLHLLHPFVHRVGYVDVVRAGLWHNHHADHGHTVHLHVAFDVGGTELRASDIAETDYPVAVAFDDKVVKHLCGIHQTHCPDVQFYGVALDASRRQFHVLVVNSVLHVHRRDAISRHLDGVEPKPHGVFLLTPYAHAAHVGYGLQLLFHREVGYFAKLQQRSFLALQSHHEYR